MSNHLTTREMEVCYLLCKDKQDKEIATLLDIEITTVRMHIENARDKTKSKTRRGLITHFLIRTYRGIKHRNFILQCREKYGRLLKGT